MPALKAIISGDADPLARELARTERMAQGSARKVEGAFAGTGRMMKSGVLREIMVLGREISYGNWTRVPGSLAILLSRLGLLKYLFSVTAGAIALAGFAAYEFWKALKNINQELDETGKFLSSPFGKMADAFRKAKVEAAEAAADFNEWLVKLAKSQETLADKTAETIKTMREEAELRRQASNIKDPAALRRMDQEERRKELDVINKALKEQKEIEENARGAATKKNSQAFMDSEAVHRKGLLSDLPDQITKAKEQVELYKAFIPQITSQFFNRSEKMDGITWDSLTSAQQNNLLAAWGNDQLPVTTKEGKSMRFSYNEATGGLDKYSRLVESLTGQQERLSETQRKLADEARDSKSDAERQKEARVRLEKERDELSKLVSLHDYYDPMISQKGDGGRFRPHVNSLQQIGAFAAPAQLDEARKQTGILREIARNTSGTGRRNSNDFTAPHF